MNNFIFNEIPSGAINGINVTFTTLNTIYKIEEVYVGGSPYRNFTFTGNVITLGFAPPTGTNVSVDYFDMGLVPSVVTSSVTLGMVIDDVYSKIGQNRLTGIIPNKVYKELQIKNSIVTGLERIKNQRVYKNVINSYNFNKADDLISKEYNPAYILVGENKKHIPASGIAVLNASTIIEYTSYSAGKLICTPGIEYQIGSKISIGYKIPSLVKKVSEVLYGGFPLEYADVRDFSINGRYYTIIKNSLGESYIVLPYTANNTKIITVNYIPNTTLPTLDADLLDIEYEYFEVLSYYALWKIYEDREDDRVDRMNRRYNELLKEYKSYKSRAVDGIKTKFKNNIILGVE